jgi:uncharacterized phiE125 gp8 family phage protein
MIGYNLASAPATYPITTSEAKSQLRIDISDDDTLIDTYIGTATAWCEEVCRAKFITQTWDFWYQNWPGENKITVMFPPLQSVTHLKYYEDDGTEYTFASSNYHVNTYSRYGEIVLKDSISWPSTTLRMVNGFVIRAIVGYGNAAAVPLNIKQAIKLLVGEMYENRENTVIAQGVSIQELPNNFKTILASLRRRRF